MATNQASNPAPKINISVVSDSVVEEVLRETQAAHVLAIDVFQGPFLKELFDPTINPDLWGGTHGLRLVTPGAVGSTQRPYRHAFAEPNDDGKVYFTEFLKVDRSKFPRGRFEKLESSSIMAMGVLAAIPVPVIPTVLYSSDANDFQQRLEADRQLSYVSLKPYIPGSDKNDEIMYEFVGPNAGQSEILEAFLTFFIINHVMGNEWKDGKLSNYKEILEYAENNGFKIEPELIYSHLLALGSKETDNYILKYMVEHGASLEDYRRLFELRVSATLHSISNTTSSRDEDISQSPILQGLIENINVELPSAFYIAMFEGLLQFFTELPEYIPLGKRALPGPLYQKLEQLIGTRGSWPGYDEAVSGGIVSEESVSEGAVGSELKVLLDKMTKTLSYYLQNPKLVDKT